MNVNPYFYLCYVVKGSRVIREQGSKWFVAQEDFADSTYPDYCSGAAYVTTVKVITKAIERVKNLRPFHVDDAFITGVAADNVPLLPWNYNFLINHVQMTEALLANNGYFTPELMVAYNLEPIEIEVLYKKALTCQRRSQDCYELLWHNEFGIHSEL